jgi:hypothetical protein
MLLARIPSDMIPPNYLKLIVAKEESASSATGNKKKQRRFSAAMVANYAKLGLILRLTKNRVLVSQTYF